MQHKAEEIGKEDAGEKRRHRHHDLIDHGQRAVELFGDARRGEPFDGALGLVVGFEDFVVVEAFGRVLRQRGGGQEQRCKEQLAE